MKKTLSVLLAVLLCLSALAPAVYALDSELDYPVIYIRGRGRELVDKDGNIVYDGEDHILDAVKDNADVIIRELAKAVVTGNYDSYCDALYNIIAPGYQAYIPDDNGNDQQGLTVLPNEYTKIESNYNVGDYAFVYDWRLDPFYSAEQLHDFIAYVKEMTGKDKVNILTRCYGSNILSAYIASYDLDDVEHIIYYASAAKGVASCGALMAGKLELDPKVVDDFATGFFDNSDPSDELISALVTALYYAKTLGFATSTVEAIYKKVKNDLMPRLMLDTIGRDPSYWAMVGDEYYEDAKKLVFGDETERFAGLIEKIDNYHYNVMNKLEDLLVDTVNKGVKCTIIGKYNVPLYPIFDASYLQADDTVELSKQTFGATSADFGQTLSSAYLSSVSQENMKYISSDKKVDASTCLFPDNTWFIRDCAHLVWPSDIHDFVMTLFHSKGEVKVGDIEEFPQFLEVDKNENVTPLGDKSKSDGRFNKEPFTNLFKLLKAFFEFVKEKILSVFDR